MSKATWIAIAVGGVIIVVLAITGVFKDGLEEMGCIKTKTKARAAKSKADIEFNDCKKMNAVWLRDSKGNVVVKGKKRQKDPKKGAAYCAGIWGKKCKDKKFLAANAQACKKYTPKEAGDDDDDD